MVSIDSLVADVHFYADADPASIGHKLLAVNLSDCAAMGAKPAWVTATISAPHLEEQWLQQFAEGFLSLAKQYNVQLVGGDIARSPHLVLTAQIHGFVPQGKALLQTGAKPGDGIFVTGTLGDAALALAADKHHLSAGQRHFIQQRLTLPSPRIRYGIAIRDIATACIDISDGLLLDLKRMLDKSSVGATVQAIDLPLSPALKAIDQSEAWQLACSGGDDYELCFTAPLNYIDALARIEADSLVPITQIGVVTESPALQVLDVQHNPLQFERLGYEHRL